MANFKGWLQSLSTLKAVLVDPRTGYPINRSIEDFATITGGIKNQRVITIGDYKQLNGKDGLLFNEVVNGTATSVHESANGGVKMTVNANGDYVIRESKATHNYTSGNPQEIELTTIDLTPVSGVVKRFGYISRSTVAPYTANLDGFCFETDNTTIYAKVYKNGTAIFSEARASWDDPLDGTGKSGLTLNLANFHAVYIDFLYLGGTCARFGFVVGNEVIIAHTFKNANFLNSTFVSSPNQPLCWEIRSTGGVGSMYHICGKVASQGDVDNVGINLAYSNGTSFINANTAGTKYALIGVKPTNRNSTVQVAKFGAMALTSDKCLIEVIINPTVAGTFTYNAITNTGYSIAYGDSAGNPSSNTVTGGVPIAAAYITGGGEGVADLQNLLKLGRTIVGVYDSAVLCVTPLTANLDMVGNITVKELA